MPGFLDTMMQLENYYPPASENITSSNCTKKRKIEPSNDTFSNGKEEKQRTGVEYPRIYCNGNRFSSLTSPLQSMSRRGQHSSHQRQEINFGCISDFNHGREYVQSDKNGEKNIHSTEFQFIPPKSETINQDSQNAKKSHRLEHDYLYNLYQIDHNKENVCHNDSRHNISVTEFPLTFPSELPALEQV